MDTEKANEAVRNGTLDKLIHEVAEQVKPEAAYFTAENGRRTAFMVFDMQDSSEMPMVSERFFQDLGADISYTPVMNMDDVQRGLSRLA